MKIDPSDFVIYCDNGLFYHIYEGTGDNLLEEDIAEGYVDYIMYDIFEMEGCILNEIDGGMILLKNYYTDHAINEIINKVADMERSLGVKKYIGDSYIFIENRG